MSEHKRFTAQEMREMAKNICRVDAMDGLTCRENCYTMKKAVLDMIRQAAEDKDANGAEIRRLRNELRIAKKKEEDIKYEFAIQKKFSRTWQTVISGIYSLGAAKETLLDLNTKNPNAERRIVRRTAGEWEVVK